MTRYIDADALIEHLKSDVLFRIVERYNIIGVIEAQPTVDAAPIQRGTWTEEYDPNADLFFRRRWRCSACNGWNTYGTPSYCPECGAEMTNSTKRKKEANHDQID